MPSILCIAYLFPPRAGVGVQRITKFVRYLPDFSWLPIVLTVKKPEGSFPLDPSYLTEIPPSVEIFKAPSVEPYHIYRSLGGKKRQDSADFRGVLEGGKKLGISGRLYSSFQSALLIPDPKIGWFGPAVRKARKILKTHKIDAIFSTSPEATDHVIAHAIARETGLPWVMDFRDPWTTSLYATKRPQWAKAKEEALELSCLTEASAITVVQDRYRDEYLQKYPSLQNQKNKFHILPNGFDINDFAGITPRQFDKWTVVYTGSISYPRDPEPFFKAWKLACEKSTEFIANSQCLFMGEFDSRFHDLKHSYIMNGQIVEGFQTRDAVYSAQTGSGALLLISEGYVTGKAYEYLAARRPILALTQGSDLKELIVSSRAGVAISPENIEGIANTLIELYNTRNQPFMPDDDYLARFDRRSITHELADILNGLARSRL